MSSVFAFDGAPFYINKKGENIIQEDFKSGLTAKECFYLYDSQGKIKPTRDPEGLKLLLKTKGSVNLHIKMYVEDLFKGYIFTSDLKEIYSEITAPEWFKKAINEQAAQLEKKSGERKPFYNQSNLDTISEAFKE